jgi:hypothetical protein
MKKITDLLQIGTMTLVFSVLMVLDPIANAQLTGLALVGWRMDYRGLESRLSAKSGGLSKPQCLYTITCWQGLETTMEE